MRKSTLSYLVTCLLIVNLAIAQTDHYGFSKIPITTTFSTNDYGGGIQNWGISQDKRGFIYVANNFGLLEYDGQDWRNYLVSNNTRSRSVFVDSDNRIYVGGQNQFGYFQSNTEGQLTFTSLYELLPEKDRNLQDIWRILKYDEQILFCSYSGIISYDGASVKKITGDEYELVFQVSKTLYAFSMKHGMASWSGTNFQRIEGSEMLAGTEITAILPHKNNSLLIFQKKGKIFTYESGQFKEWELPIGNFLQSALINTALLLNNNEIAIGTQNNGLVILSPSGKVLRHLTKEKGLSNRTVLSLYEDQFSNLWVGMNNGLAMVELSSPFSLINEQSGLPGTGYSALIHDNKLYLGTSNGLFYQNAQPNPLNAEAQYQLVKNSGGQVYKLQNLNGKLFLAHHNGAFEVKDDVANQFYDRNGTWKFHQFTKSGKLMAGTYEGFVSFDYDNGRFVNPKHIGEFGESSRVFEFIDDNTLFMAHGYKGIFKIAFDQTNNDISKIDFYGKNKGFPSDRLINVFRVGSELVFPAEFGVYGYNNAKDVFEHHSILESQLDPGSHVMELEYNYNGNLYFLTDRELGYLQQNSYGNYEKVTSKFIRIKKYLSDDLENISALDYENVLFGAKEGFVHYNPNMPYVRDQAFKTFIRKIESVTDAHKVDYNGAGSLDSLKYAISYPANFSSLKFTFSAPYFDGQEAIEFQYQLENFDKDWSEWSTFNEKEYTNLSQGDYSFKVRARNIFGDISAPTVYKFSVYPPWYRSKLAYFFYIVILACAFVIAMYIQSRKHQRDKELLTQNQELELLKKDSEIEKVSKASEEQINKLKNDKLRSEIDHKNRELATTTMHLINKNEFMLTVRDTIKELSKSNSKEGIKKLVKEIDRNLAEDEGWEQFTKHFDQVHGDFLKNIKKDHPTLTPQEIKLCAYLRMNMSSKEIANLLNISVRGVEISRYRLRKKLNISRDTNLVDYMLEFS